MHLLIIICLLRSGIGNSSLSSASAKTLQKQMPKGSSPAIASSYHNNNLEHFTLLGKAWKKPLHFQHLRFSATPSPHIHTCHLGPFGSTCHIPTTCFHYFPDDRGRHRRSRVHSLGPPRPPGRHCRPAQMTRVDAIDLPPPSTMPRPWRWRWRWK